MSQGLQTIRRALLSVSDKTGLLELGRSLVAADIELISTGGTAKALKDDGLPVRDVSEVTNFPEMMDGRVKTLHPSVHGGLLAVRGNESHEAAAKAHGISPIDLLVVNLYPFEQTVHRSADYDECVENIDIGGPAMIRAAAKNHAAVTVIVDPSDYSTLEDELNTHGGATTLAFRKSMAAKAYSRTAVYDAAISNWFARELNDPSPHWKVLSGQKSETLRYGENPHQQATFYRTDEQRCGIATAVQHQGKALSYNNLNDTDAALELVSEFRDGDEAAVAIIKHANPCGVAVGKTLADAYRLALRCDPVSAFGGIIAVNKTIDGATAEEMTKIFTEVVVGPDADKAAHEVFAAKKNLRLLTTGGLADPAVGGDSIKTLSGGFLVQSRDGASVETMDLKVVTDRQPTEQEWADLRFAFKIAKHVKSNAIVYAKDGATVGIGAGQMSRVDSTRIAAWKAQSAAEQAGVSESLTKGSVVASDAFFPFADGLIAAAEAGATAVIQPGGSVRDDEVIAAANERGLAMVFTGIRHFRH
jgi:phosphoribosylaminoimidazolecarboxamide formyltransferase / IMP cyclohydrolase